LVDARTFGTPPPAARTLERQEATPGIARATSTCTGSRGPWTSRSLVGSARSTSIDSSSGRGLCSTSSRDILDVAGATAVFPDANALRTAESVPVPSDNSDFNSNVSVTSSSDVSVTSSDVTSSGEDEGAEVAGLVFGPKNGLDADVASKQQPKQQQQQRQLERQPVSERQQQWRAMIRTMVDAHGKAASARKPSVPRCSACGVGSPGRGRPAGCERCREILALDTWVAEQKRMVSALVAAGYKHWEDIPKTHTSSGGG